jgi:hypothetical protein
LRRSRANEEIDQMAAGSSTIIATIHARQVRSVNRRADREATRWSTTAAPGTASVNSAHFALGHPGPA